MPSAMALVILIPDIRPLARHKTLTPLGVVHVPAAGFVHSLGGSSHLVRKLLANDTHRHTDSPLQASQRGEPRLEHGFTYAQPTAVTERQHLCPRMG